MPGHLFITQGDLTKLACDAWIVPTDGRGVVTSHWTPALGRESLHEFADRLERREPVVVPAAVPPAVAVNSGADEEDATWYADGLIAAIEHAARAVKRDRRTPPLIATPLVGIGAGGAREFRGEVVAEEVRRLLELVSERDYDVALVTFTKEALAAAQAARRLVIGPQWPTYTDAAADLADRAERGNLVLFLGSGVSAGAGYPLWDALLNELVDQLDAPPPAGFKELDLLDQAEIVRRRLGDDRFRETIRKRFTGDRQSLQHQLLAALPVHEAATTNYDTLFESAWSAVDQQIATLPENPAKNAHRWLLKLHGSVTDTKRELVLCREDYLRVGASDAALAGLVHSMLITRHMLFVGFSLTDDTFYRIAHDVRAVLGSARQRPGSDSFGTALMLAADTLRRELWAGDVDFLDAGSARGIEIFLDRLRFETADPLAHFFDQTFSGLLSDDERAVAEQVRALKLTGPSGEALRQRLGLS